jgi:saccharopine dehydrogenase (NAD+, L-lysine forming)
VPLFDSADELTNLVKSKIDEAVPSNGGKWPQVIIMGALGRCGKGATEAAQTIGVPEASLLLWDLKEAKENTAPYKAIAESDVFVNAVYLGATKVPPFVTADSLSEPGRRLRTIADVSCDPNASPNCPNANPHGANADPRSEREQPHSNLQQLQQLRKAYSLAFCEARRS